MERDQISFAIWPREEIRLRWRDKGCGEGGSRARVCVSACIVGVSRFTRSHVEGEARGCSGARILYQSQC